MKCNKLLDCGVILNVYSHMQINYRNVFWYIFELSHFNINFLRGMMHVFQLFWYSLPVCVISGHLESPRSGFKPRPTGQTKARRLRRPKNWKHTSIRVMKRLINNNILGETWWNVKPKMKIVIRGEFKHKCMHATVSVLWHPKWPRRPKLAKFKKVAAHFEKIWHTTLYIMLFTFIWLVLFWRQIFRCTGVLYAQVKVHILQQTWSASRWSGCVPMACDSLLTTSLLQVVNRLVASW